MLITWIDCFQSLLKPAQISSPPRFMDTGYLFTVYFQGPKVKSWKEAMITAGGRD